jgi:hypothetical protein
VSLVRPTLRSHVGMNVHFVGGWHARCVEHVSNHIFAVLTTGADPVELSPEFSKGVNPEAIMLSFVRDSASLLESNSK